MEKKLLIFILITIAAASLWKVLPVNTHTIAGVGYGYCYPLGVVNDNKSETTVSLLLQERHRNTVVRLFNINHEVVDSVIIESNNEAVTQEDIGRNGYRVNNRFVCKTALPPGLYFWENKVPMVVSTKEAVDVTYVIPNYSLQSWSKFGFDGQVADTVSLKRPTFLPNKLVDFLAWAIANTKGTYNVITDASLSKPINAKKLVFFSYGPHWTEEMLRQVTLFNNEGGELIILTNLLATKSTVVDGNQLINQQKNTNRENVFPIPTTANRRIERDSLLLVIDDKSAKVMTGITADSLYLPHRKMNGNYFYAQRELWMEKNEDLDAQYHITSLAHVTDTLNPGRMLLIQRRSIGGPIFQLGFDILANKAYEKASLKKLITNAINVSF